MFNDVKSITYHRDSSFKNEFTDTLIDYERCDRLMQSLERYSQKLDKLLETTENIEKTSLKE